MKKTVSLVVAAVIFTMLLLTLTVNAGKKVTICHNGNTISVSENALDAHLKHGDTIGPCTTAQQPTQLPPTATNIPVEPTNIPATQQPKPTDAPPYQQPTAAPVVVTIPPSDSVCSEGCATGCCPGEEAAHYGEATRSVAEAEYWKSMATAVLRNEQ